jgi:hypothetical protein
MFPFNAVFSFASAEFMPMVDATEPKTMVCSAFLRD